MERLARLVEEHEGWLTDRVVLYAHQHDFARYTSTLREAWRASICGFSGPLITVLSRLRERDGPIDGPVREAVDFGVQEAILHRSRGVELTQFLGLLKLYRRAYVDLVDEKVPKPDQHRWLVSLLLEMFDSVEIGLVGEWTRSRQDEVLAELHERNRQLTNEKNKYLTVFESIAEPAILLDTESRPLHMNAAGHRLLLGDETPGAGYYGSGVDPRLPEIVADIIRKAGTDAAVAGHIRLETVQGPRSFKIALQEMQDISRKFAGQVAILNDVTELLAAIETAEVADRAKSAFLATVSHEINTPINSIGGLARLLDDGTLSPTQQRHLAGIRSALDLLQELTENVLGLSRSEARALQHDERDFDLSFLITSLLGMFSGFARERGIVLAQKISPDVPTALHGDEAKLRHVLMNLLSNAVKFTPSGRVDVRITLAEGSTATHPRLLFEVADTGVGLPQGDVEWLFEPFTQCAHPQLTTAVRGAGLGLAICKRMVSFLGGTISATSAPGKGSVFAVELAFTHAEHAAGTSTVQTGLDILVVEDDPASAMVAEGILLELGQKPQVVHSFAMALQALTDRRFDLVLTDHRLGDSTGLDLARALHGGPDPSQRGIPVVLVTAAAPADMVPGAATADFDLVIQKPYIASDLAKAIRQVTGRTALALPQPAAPAEEPLLDRRVLNQLLTDLGFERCSRVVAIFVENAPVLRRKLSAALRDGNAVAAADAAHQLMSASSVVGLRAVREASRQVQSHCSRRGMRQAREAHARLERLCDRSAGELDAFWAEFTDTFHASFHRDS